MAVTLGGNRASESGFSDIFGVSSCLPVALRGVDTVDGTGSGAAEVIDIKVIDDG